MHAAKYIKVEPSYKNCHMDIYFKKNVVAHARNVEASVIFFQAFNSVIRSFNGSSSQCFEVPTALSLWLMLRFSRSNVDPIDQVKSSLS